MFGQGEILRALTRLGEIAWGAERVIDLAVYGGSAIVLAWGFRVATKDVDAVVRGDSSFLRRAVRQVAEEQGWPEDWLNDGVKGFISGNEDLRLQGTYPSPERPGLRVYVPTAEYMLAMKCMAMRAEGVEEARDIEDIRHLIGTTGMTTTEQVLTLVEGFYPRSLIPPRVALGVEEIVNELSQDARDKAGR